MEAVGKEVLEVFDRTTSQSIEDGVSIVINDDSKMNHIFLNLIIILIH